MSRFTFVIITSLLLTACGQAPATAYSASWDSIAYVNPMAQPQYGAMMTISTKMK